MVLHWFSEKFHTGFNTSGELRRAPVQGEVPPGHASRRMHAEWSNLLRTITKNAGCWILLSLTASPPTDPSDD